MAETILTGYAEATGSAPNEPTARNQNGSVGLYIAFDYPVQNDALDPSGLPQPLVPPIEIQYVETRFTYDDAAATDWTDPTIVWTKHHKVAPIGPSAILEDPNQPYDPDSNIFIPLQGQLAIRPLIIKANVYFQMRCISRAGVPSDWTDIVKLELTPDVVNGGNDTSFNRLPCSDDQVAFIPGNTV